MSAPINLHPHDAGMNLALAVIASSTAPLLLLDDKLNIVAASDSFCHAFAIIPTTTPGASIFTLGAGEWNVPQLRSLLDATLLNAEIHAYEMDLKRDGRETRRLVLNAHKLTYLEGEPVRLLLSIADLTDTRHNEHLKDDLLREKSILLMELQHRVANSLQIIASVLLQSARRVESEETRVHLTDAHSRVMSIAAVERQLAVSRIGNVEMNPYLSQLCASLGASMIHNHDKVSIQVHADESVSHADDSVCIGLIVTELVINALKHAFPDDRHGVINVNFMSRGVDWTLTVTDDGVGIPTGPDAPKAGLGSSIVQALASQLQAGVRVTDLAPGTAVSVHHGAVASLFAGVETPPAPAV